MLSDVLRELDAQQAIIDRHRPFGDAALLREIRDFYRVGIVYSSNAIEGCTYTLSETKILLEDGLTAGGKPLKDAYAVTGLARAYDYMFGLLHGAGITEEDLLTMHGLLGGGLENEAVAGTYRDGPIFVTGSRYPVCRPEDIAARMRTLLAREQATRRTTHPLVHAARFHKELVFIHPFADGNGRVARLAMNVLLIQRGYLPVAVPPVLRHEYIESLETAHTNETPFLTFMARCAVETQKDFLRLIGE